MTVHLPPSLRPPHLPVFIIVAGHRHAAHAGQGLVQVKIPPPRVVLQQFEHRPGQLLAPGPVAFPQRARQVKIFYVRARHIRPQGQRVAVAVQKGPPALMADYRVAHMHVLSLRQVQPYPAAQGLPVAQGRLSLFIAHARAAERTRRRFFLRPACCTARPDFSPFLRRPWPVFSGEEAASVSLPRRSAFPPSHFF